MAKITFWGDFKVNETEHLNLDGQLQLLLNQSDFNVVNFEAPVHSKGKSIQKSGPNISQSSYAPQWLEEHGFNVISLANNHIMDYGVDGLNATMSRFKHSFTIGAGSWSDAYKIRIVTTLDGIKVGLIAATHREFGTLTEKADKVGTSWCCHPDIERAILIGGGYSRLSYSY